MNPLNVPPADPGNAVIAHTLHWLAVLLEIDDGDAQRIADYRQAAHRVRQLDQSVAEVVRAHGASGLERLGIKPVIAVMISDWIRTGELPVLDRERREHGLWPALTRALCKTLGIEPGLRTEKRPARRERLEPSLARRRMAAGAPIHRQVWESWN